MNLYIAISMHNNSTWVLRTLDWIVTSGAVEQEIEWLYVGVFDQGSRPGESDAVHHGLLEASRSRDIDFELQNVSGSHPAYRTAGLLAIDHGCDAVLTIKDPVQPDDESFMKLLVKLRDIERPDAVVPAGGMFEFSLWKPEVLASIPSDLDTLIFDNLWEKAVIYWVSE